MQYKAKQDAKLWKNPDLTAQISTIKAGTVVTGTSIGGGVLQITKIEGSTNVGYSKAIWFSAITVTPPPPPSPTDVTLTHTIEIYDNGSIKVDGVAFP